MTDAHRALLDAYLTTRYVAYDGAVAVVGVAGNAPPDPKAVALLAGGGETDCLRRFT